MNESMNIRARLLGLALLVVGAQASLAGNLDMIGVTLLRQVDPSLRGQGVSVAQAEAPISTASPPPFEVNPSAVGQSPTIFTWFSALGTASEFPNSIGAESSHADGVGANLFGAATGAASAVAHVDNYEGQHFYDTVVSALGQPAIADRIVNQSFIFDGLTASEQATVEQNYDDYAAVRNVLFVSGAGNGGPVMAAATCYNGLGVGVYGASSSTGPTADGRSKPDLTAPGGATSGSTPYVAGVAAVLLQAATRGDGGGDVSSASDARTLKALLLNGAVKPRGWSNSVTMPLDTRYGAGIVNAFNSWNELRGGQHAFIESTSNASGAPHPPGVNPGNMPTLMGWDFNALTNSRSGPSFSERVNHYYFNLDPAGGGSYAGTVTLAWNRQRGQAAVNDLNLFLYNTLTGGLVASSTSAVDNVEHVFLGALPAGRYDLQVQKNPAGQVSAGETYALAFEFFNLKLAVAPGAGSVTLSWPVAPAGFVVQSASSLSPPVVWSPVTAPVTITNNQNTVKILTAGSGQFFRLSRP